MNRRDFFRRSAIVAAGVVAADQLELVERLGWKRRLFAGWRPDPKYYGVLVNGSGDVHLEMLDGRTISISTGEGPGHLLLPVRFKRVLPTTNVAILGLITIDEAKGNRWHPAGLP